MTARDLLAGLVAEPPKRDLAFPRCDHPGCAHEGNFGFRLSRTLTARFCAAHRDEGERRMPGNVGRAAA